MNTSAQLCIQPHFTRQQLSGQLPEPDGRHEFQRDLSILHAASAPPKAGFHDTASPVVFPGSGSPGCAQVALPSQGKHSSTSFRRRGGVNGAGVPQVTGKAFVDFIPAKFAIRLSRGGTKVIGKASVGFIPAKFTIRLSRGGIKVIGKVSVGFIPAKFAIRLSRDSTKIIGKVLSNSSLL